MLPAGAVLGIVQFFVDGGAAVVGIGDIENLLQVAARGLWRLDDNFHASLVAWLRRSLNALPHSQ